MSEDKIIVKGIELKIHTELKLIKPYMNFKTKGARVRIRSISGDFIKISGGDGESIIHKDNIFKYFTRVRPFNINHKWTDWIETKDGFSYRTDNEHYTEVKKDGYHAKSACHPCDRFNLPKGIAVCLDRIKEKEQKSKAKVNEFWKTLKYKDAVTYDAIKNPPCEEIVIDLIKNLKGKIIDLQLDIDDDVRDNGLNQEYTGVKSYTIRFTEYCK